MHSRGVPTPSAGDKIRSGCLTPAFSGAQKRGELLHNPSILRFLNKGDKIRSGYLGGAFSRAQKRVELLRNPCILGGSQRQARGKKSEAAASPLPSRGPKRGGNCYTTPAFSGILKKGYKSRSGYLTPAFSRAQKRVELLRNPCILGGSPTPSTGPKSEMAASPLPCRGAKRGWDCYATPAFPGVPNAKRGDKIRSGCLTPAFSQSQKTAELLHNPCILGGGGRGGRRQARGKNQRSPPHPCLLANLKEGGIAMQPLHSRGGPQRQARGQD